MLILLLCIGSKVIRSSTRFILANIESGGQLVVIKERASSSLPPKMRSIDLNVKTSRSKKKKSSGAHDFGPENLAVEEALLKLISFSQSISSFELLLVLLYFTYNDLLQVADHVSQSNEDLWLRVERAEHALKEQDGTNRDLIHGVEKPSKEKSEREEEHTLEIQKVLFELKSNVTEAI